jgi:hypothetical protein
LPVERGAQLRHVGAMAFECPVPEQPLPGFGPAAQAGRQAEAGFFCQVQQDRTRFLQRHGLAAIGRPMVDHGQRGRLGDAPERQPGFFQEHQQLLPVGRGDIVEVQHGIPFDRSSGTIVRRNLAP